MSDIEPGERNMRLEMNGLTFEAPRASFYLWSPWRASALEHRLFSSVEALPNTEREVFADEQRVHIRDPKTWRSALQAVARVMKGWQEDASDAGRERRGWRWLLEADMDADGFDHTGVRSNLWGFLRVSIDRNAAGEEEKGEDIDLNGFGLCIWNERT